MGGPVGKLRCHGNECVQRVVLSMHTVVVNKKLMFCFRFTIVEQSVLSKKTNRKRSHCYTLYIIRYGTLHSKGHDRLTASEKCLMCIKMDDLTR